MKINKVIKILMLSCAILVSPITAQELPKEDVFKPMIRHDGNTALALNDRGEVFVWGSNMSGQMALGYTSEKAYITPQKIDSLNNIVQVDVNNSVQVALDKDGKVYTWGWNVWNVLGYPGHKATVCSPQLVKELPPIKQVEVGDKNIYYLDMDGKVWVSGSNRLGQLGNGSDKPSGGYPSQVPGLTDVVDIAAGGFNGYGTYVLVVKNDGSVWGWGNSDSALKESGNNCRAISEDGEEYISKPSKIEALSNIIKIDTYLQNAMFLKSDGTVLLTPLSPNHMFPSYHFDKSCKPIDLGITDIMDIAIERGSFTALKKDGTVYIGGIDSEYHQFINKTEEKMDSANQDEEWFKMHPFTQLSNIIDISGGGWNGIGALDAEGNVFMWNTGRTLMGKPKLIEENYGETFEVPVKIKGLDLIHNENCVEE